MTVVSEPSSASGDVAAPIIVLRPIGDGNALYRVLARVLVRRELIFASAIPDPDDCENLRAAG